MQCNSGKYLVTINLKFSMDGNVYKYRPFNDYHHLSDTENNHVLCEQNTSIMNHVLILLTFLHIDELSGWPFRSRHIFEAVNLFGDRLCGLVVRVSGYRYRGLGFDSRRYQIF